MILCASNAVPSAPSMMEPGQRFKAVGPQVPASATAKAPLTPTLSPIGDGGEGVVFRIQEASAGINESQT